MRKSVRIFWQIFFILFGLGILTILLANWGVFGKMPSMEELENPTITQASEVLAADGTPMGKYYLPNGNRSLVKYKDISPNVINALVATEDKRFYDHAGIDLKGTLRAIFLFGSEGGGSTITQQLALALFNQRASNKAVRVIQKLKEWIISVKLERNFTKEEIIALYLNAVPFSDNVYGIRNAAKTWFQKEPDRLTVDEAALLVGMINGPGIYNPRRNPKLAMDRRNLVIARMVENNNLSAAEGQQLQAMPIKLNYKKIDENTGYAPYFRDVLRDELKSILKDLKKPDGSSYSLYEDGLKIYTTINPLMQQYAEEAVYAQVPNLQRALVRQSFIKDGSVWKGHENILQRAMKESDRWRNMADDGFTDKEIRASFFKKVPMKVFAWNANKSKDTVMTPYDSIKYHRTMVQSAFMVMDPVTGEVRAWVGGIDFKTYKYDHANIRTKRQVGSTIKPLLYAQAVDERGMTPDSPVEDVQQDFGNGQLVPATSRTCSGRTMTMASALAWSKNCATAYIMKQVGTAQFVNFLQRINIPTKVPNYPSIALGSCELSLFEMLWGYSIFGGRGFSTKPYFISRIEDRNGNVIKRFDYSANRKEAISEASAYIMTRMMQGVVDKGTAAGLRARLGAAEMAGKTGTTNDNADAWFMGFTPQLLAGVWVGCDDRFIRNDSKGGFGGEAARPIWEAFFKKIYADKSLGINKDEKFPEPPSMDNELLSADPSMYVTSDSVTPTAEGEDAGVGTEQDYMQNNNEYIGPESKPIMDEDKPQKDTTKKEPPKATQGKPIGSQEEPKKKKGLFNRIFGKKDKKNPDQHP
ncbi:peptidoglycan glycosyltransferase [Niabella ginsenosidivorans]|uniref:Peptidoglycan glycosyltransferase n=1 Tax=Niabella ginsenosidivorans TaxID=1176587 RepID=A0A1A9HZU2_9BACT|nr:transglycosylase domain-containing protein [Niabella ginsenosidivorans]ANH79942.1 peptidoglycan glycosyltransferase [Niabella ginsenosidivorans]